MSHDQRHPERPNSRITRRDALKAAVLFGAVALMLPALRLADFLFPPKQTNAAANPRLLVAKSSDVPTGQSFLFEYPHKDRPAILIHLSDGGFVAYDAACTHLGCLVHFDKVPVRGWESNPQQIFCPCHGGVFDPKNANVLGGPPPRPRPKIKLEIDTQGNIYANGYESGLPFYGEG
jgi:Rieske Fe-S protein